MTTPVYLPLTPGIYLADEVPFDRYFSDPAVSASDTKKLLEGVDIYWESSWMNPDRADMTKDRLAMEEGKVFHCLLLEPDKFYERYFIQPGQTWRNEKDKYGRPLFRMVTKNRKNELDIQVKQVRKIKGIEEMLDPNNGYPEVTVVWRDLNSGVLCRARHDWFGWGWTTDYKTTAKVDDESLRHTFWRFRYDIQQAHYLDSRTSIRQQILEGNAKWGDGFSEDFKNRFMAEDDDLFAFIFQKSSVPYTPRELWLTQNEVDEAMLECRKARMKFAAAMSIYGENERWEVSYGEGREFSMRYGFNQAD